MSKKCTVCAHADVDKINAGLIEGATLDSLAKVYGLTIAALHRHKKHIPEHLAKAQDVQEIAAADSLMGRVAALDAKAEDIYTKASEAQNLNAAIAAVREMRGITELYAKITGELQTQTVNNIIIMPEWVSLRNAILYALEAYPAARQAVIEAVGRIQV